MDKTAQDELGIAIYDAIDARVSFDVIAWHPQAVDPIWDAAVAVMKLLRQRGLV